MDTLSLVHILESTFLVKYTNSILYSSKNYEDDKYGNYDWEGKDFYVKFVKLDSQKKNVSDSVKYIMKMDLRGTRS